MSFFRDNVSTSFYKKDWVESLKSKLFEIQQSKFLVTQSYIEIYSEFHRMYGALKQEQSRLDQIIDDIDIQRRGLFVELTKEQNDLYTESKKRLTFVKRRISACSAVMTSMSINKDWSPERQPRVVFDTNNIADSIIVIDDEKVEEKKETKNNNIADSIIVIDDEKIEEKKETKNNNIDDAVEKVEEKKETKTEQSDMLVAVMPCCRGDCKGLVTRNYKCGLCHSKYCKSCRVIKTSEEHTCDPDTVATVQLIKDTAKPCPKCKTSITKIDGCDQMWCPQCKTAFSYNTGKIDTGSIHNPHYYQFLRETQGHVPRAQGDNPYCPQDENELVLAYDLFFRRNTRGTLNFSVAHNTILDIHRQLLHINRYRPKTIDLTADTIELRDLRIRYLMNKITKEDMCDHLIKTHNVNIRTNEVALVYEMVIRSVNDTLRILSNIQVRPSDDLDRHCLEAIATIKKIVTIANDAFEVIAKRWKVKAIRFDDMLKEVKSNAS